MSDENTKFTKLNLSDVALTNQATFSKIQTGEININTLYQFITTRNSNLYKLSFRIITYFLIIQPIIFTAYLMELLSPNHTLFIIAAATLLPVLLQSKLKLNLSESLSRFSYNYAKIDKNVKRLELLQMVLAFSSFIGLGVGFLLLEEVTLELFIVAFFLLSGKSLLEQVTNEYICRFDRSIRKKINRNNLNKANNIIVIDESSNIYALKGLIYTHGETVLGAVSFTDENIPVNSPDSFTPNIDRSALEEDEQIVSWERYSKSIIGNPLNSEQDVEIVATEITRDSDTTQTIDTIESLLQQQNPYYLSADDLAKLSEEGVCKEYFRKIEETD